MSNHEPEQRESLITWERARAICGNAPPPREVWESQFDYCDEELRRIARKPYREIERADLWYYFHDLAYVDLQPDLFAYLFPVCLMDWHATLHDNESCARGDSEFHYGLRQGNVLAKMLTAEQRQHVVEFFRDSFLERLDAEPIAIAPSINKFVNSWIYRFNSLAYVIERLDVLWEPWWAATTRGRAVAVLKYASGFACSLDENPVIAFGTDTPRRDGPYLYENDSYIYDASWPEPNLRFLREVLTYDYLVARVEAATRRLAGEPGERFGELVTTELLWNQPRAERRIEDLLRKLAGVGDKHQDWTD